MPAQTEIIFLAVQKNVPSEEAYIYKRPTEYIFNAVRRQNNQLTSAESDACR